MIGQFRIILRLRYCIRHIPGIESIVSVCKFSDAAGGCHLPAFQIEEKPRRIKKIPCIALPVPVEFIQMHAFSGMIPKRQGKQGCSVCFCDSLGKFQTQPGGFVRTVDLITHDNLRN